MKMKNYLVGIFALCMLVFASCEEDGDQAKVKSTVASNDLTAPGTSFVLTFENKDDIQHFEWTATDFGFPASITYKLEMDKAGNNFATAFELASTQATEADVKVSKMNEGLLALELTPEEAADVEFRVVSTIGSGVDPVYSAIRSAAATPYATSFPPIWGMGAALKGWGPWPANEVEWQSSQFKKYETIAYFTSGEAFRWFAQHDWGPTSYNYPFFTSVSSVFVNANDGDSNLKVAGATGWYRVAVDLSAKTVTAEAVSEPIMYMTGAGIGGWDQPGTGASIKMTYIKPGVFEADANFISGETWRFFAQADWGPTSYNYPYFTSVDSKFENAQDGDKNFRVLGTSGTKHVTVNINEGVKSVVLD